MFLNAEEHRGKRKGTLSLLKLASKCLKYSLIVIFAFAIACIWNEKSNGVFWGA